MCLYYNNYDSCKLLEMQGMNVYKNYEPGEQSRRLYVKNLNKQVNEKVASVRVAVRIVVSS